MKIYIWPDGGWCEEHELESFQRDSGRSDDYSYVTLPDNIDSDGIDKFVCNWLDGQEYRWVLKVNIFGGHRIYLDQITGKYAISDAPRTPDKAPDGVLWIDTESPLMSNGTTWGVPVLSKDGKKLSTVATDDEAQWLAVNLHMSVKIGSTIFRTEQNIQRIPMKDNVGDISTGHITRKDAKLLQSGGVPGLVGAFEYGYFVITHSVKEVKERELVRSFGMSEAYIKLLEVAFDQGYYYLVIDQDGPHVEGLERFEW